MPLREDATEVWAQYCKLAYALSGLRFRAHKSHAYMVWHVCCRWCCNGQCGQALLQCTGLYVEGMDRSDGDVAALERRWLKPIYTAAPQLVLRHAQLTVPTVVHKCQSNGVTEEEPSSNDGQPLSWVSSI